ncbi:MAG: glutathione binding-like protein [Candidatus Binatia bacterium]
MSIFLKNIEKELATNGPWLVGNMYTLADIGLTPYVYRLMEMGLTGMWSGPQVPHFLTIHELWEQGDRR